MSSPRPPDPRRLDVASFARSAGVLEGEWPLASMRRLMQDALPLTADSPTHSVTWSARGEMQTSADGETRTHLHLRARTALRLTCQRCLQPVVVEFDVAPTLRFVRDEALAERLDEESDEDVLAMTSTLDLHDLLEDELILALPLVPRHEQCPQPLPMSAGELGDHGREEGEGAFAALADLLKDRRGKPN
jgi:uncharacterized protein